MGRRKKRYVFWSYSSSESLPAGYCIAEKYFVGLCRVMGVSFMTFLFNQIYIISKSFNCGIDDQLVSLIEIKLL